MEYMEFKTDVVNTVSVLLGDENNVKLHQIVKNNSVVKDAIVISEEGKNISPTIYLDSFYEEYQNGRDIHSIAEQIIDINKLHAVNKNFETEDFFEFDRVKEKIIFKVINTDKNEMLLSDVPHREIYDLSIVYSCFFDDLFYDHATTIIYNKHMNKWGISEDELYEIAYVNTISYLGKCFKTMNEVMVDMLSCDTISKETRNNILNQLVDDDEICPMYVLTNECKLFGASLLIYNDILYNMAEKIGDFYIIPSSIHELIIVPDGCNMDEQFMLDMVSEVNSTQLSYDEVLSDSIYHYEKGKNVINMINKIKLTTFLSNS